MSRQILVCLGALKEKLWPLEPPGEYPAGNLEADRQDWSRFPGMNNKEE